MRYYLTEYRAGLGGLWPAQIRARSLPHAREIVRLRGLGERVTSPALIRGHRDWERRPLPLILPSEVLRHQTGLAAQVHSLCWLGLLACSSGVAEARDFFDDETGVLHVLAHLWGWAGYSRRERRALRADMLQRVRRMERKVPGGV